MRKTLSERERAIAGVEAAMLRGEVRPYVIVRVVEGVKSYRTAKRFMETVRERWRASNGGVSPPPQRGRVKSVPCEPSEAELRALRDRILEQPLEGETAEEHAARIERYKAEQEAYQARREEYIRVHGEISPIMELYI
jgi:hypothetical protein